jgi:hypothetical protein
MVAALQAIVVQEPKETKEKEPSPTAQEEEEEEVKETACGSLYPHMCITPPPLPPDLTCDDISAHNYH